MRFLVDRYETLQVSDKEIFELLYLVYVEAGFTTEEVAKKVFDPVAVRSRGVMFASREVSTNKFAGMVIVVPPESDSIVRAKENECEIHLLGVRPGFRGQGLGRKLIELAIAYVEANNWSKIILWTQKPMKEAQKLYESLGFMQVGEMTKNQIEFLIYERDSKQKQSGETNFRSA